MDVVRRMVRDRMLTVLAVVLIVLSMWALLNGSDISEIAVQGKPENAESDIALYETIADRVRGGESYYAVAVAEQAANHYPTSPPPTIRLPTVTLVSVVFGDWAVWVLRALIAGCAVTAMLRLEKIVPTRAEWIGATFLLAVSISVYASPEAVFFAEGWAVCLILLSLLVHRDGHWGASVTLGLVAVLFRELAGPYLIVMGLLAWRRRRKEAVAWFASAAGFLVLYGAHWMLALRAADTNQVIASDSWISFGGWPYVVETFRASSILSAGPYWLSVFMVAFSLCGWAAFRGEHRDRVVAVSVAFMCLFMVAGRPNTSYWGHLYVPLLLPGLVFFPRYLVRGWSEVSRRPRASPAE